MKSYSNGFGGTPILGNLHMQRFWMSSTALPNGLFLPGPRLVPMAHRNHPQLGRDGPFRCSWRGENHCSGQSSSWQSLGKSHETHQNQIKIQIRWLHFPSIFNVGHCPSLGRLPGATSNSDAAPWPEISWNWRIWSCLCHVVGCHVFNVYVHANRLISWYYIDDYRCTD